MIDKTFRIKRDVSINYVTTDLSAVTKRYSEHLSWIRSAPIQKLSTQLRLHNDMTNGYSNYIIDSMADKHFNK